MFSSIARPIARATRHYGYADRPLFQAMLLAIAKPIARATRDYGCADSPLFLSMILVIVMHMRVQRATTDVLNARCFNLCFWRL
jgi:hypothetical protein